MHVKKIVHTYRNQTCGLLIQRTNSDQSDMNSFCTELQKQKVCDSSECILHELECWSNVMQCTAGHLHRCLVQKALQSTQNEDVIYEMTLQSKPKAHFKLVHKIVNPFYCVTQ